jgi:acetolactate synthase-1/2/3 large subunit
MLCVGARFDDRVTGRLDAFSPGSKKIHIDIDPSSINKNVRVDVPVVADCGKALAALIDQDLDKEGRQGAGPETLDRADRHLARPQGLRLSELENADQAAIRHRASLRADQATSDVYITTEVGQHQMWAASSSTSTSPTAG